MADVYLSNGGLAPTITNFKSSVAGSPSVPFVADAHPPPPNSAATTTSIIKTAKSHKVTFSNGQLSGPQLE